jgi:predicted DNA-binding transcriptional regulator AlpA/DNA-binding XRE family transcriptional regulator
MSEERRLPADLVTARKKAGVGLSELARSLDISRFALGKIERCERPIPEGFAERYAETLARASSDEPDPYKQPKGLDAYAADVLDVKEAALELRVGEKALYRAVEEDRFPHYRKIGTRIVFPKCLLREFLGERPDPYALPALAGDRTEETVP